MGMTQGRHCRVRDKIISVLEGLNYKVWHSLLSTAQHWGTSPTGPALRRCNSNRFCPQGVQLPGPNSAQSPLQTHRRQGARG